MSEYTTRSPPEPERRSVYTPQRGADSYWRHWTSTLCGQKILTGRILSKGTDILKCKGEREVQRPWQRKALGIRYSGLGPLNDVDLKRSCCCCFYIPWTDFSVERRNLFLRSWHSIQLGSFDFRLNPVIITTEDMIHPTLPYASDPWPRHGQSHFAEYRISSSASASSSNSMTEGSPPRTVSVVKCSPRPPLPQKQKSFLIEDILGNSDTEQRAQGQIDSASTKSAGGATEQHSPLQHETKDGLNGGGIPARPVPIRISPPQGRNPPSHLHPQHHAAQQPQQQSTVAPILKPTPVYDPLALVGSPYQQLAAMSTYAYSTGGLHGVLPYARPEMLFLERTGIFPKSKHYFACGPLFPWYLRLDYFLPVYCVRTILFVCWKVGLIADLVRIFR